MALFTGTHYNKVDRKGRISVPAAFRAVLSELGLEGLFVFPSLDEKCIVGSGPDILRELTESTSDLDFFSPEYQYINRRVFGQSHELAWDPEGRVMLPAALLSHAGIGEQAAFVGLGRSFQIWDPVLLTNQQGADLQVARPKLTLRRPEAK